MSGPINRTTVELFRDCLRLVKHVAPGYSPKAIALRQTVRAQFKAGKHETDPTKIEHLKANAVRALSNYMLYQSAQKEPQLQRAMKDQIKRSSNDMKKNDENETETNNNNEKPE